MEDSVLKYYESLFSSMLDLDPEIRNQAFSEIQRLIKEERPNFILSCTFILEQYQKLNLLLIKQTILYLNFAFSPDYDKEYMHNLWNKVWKISKTGDDNNLLRNRIKNACLNLFESKDKATRDLASQCLSSIAIYDRGNFDAMFLLLVRILIKDQINSTDEARLSALITIKYFFQNLKKESENFTFSSMYINAFTLFVTGVEQILNNFHELDEPFIIEIFETLASFAYIDRSYFSLVLVFGNDEIKIRNKEIITRLFHTIFNIAQSNANNENIFRSFHHFFFSLYHSIYDYIDREKIPEEKFTLAVQDLYTLFDEYINKINFLTIFPPTNVSYIAIDFWNEIGKFEKKRLKFNAKIDKFKQIAEGADCHLLKTPLFLVLDHYRDNLLPILLKSMELVDPDKENSIDLAGFAITNSDLHIYATSVVHKLFYFNHLITSQYIFDYFKETLNQTPVLWNVRLAQMQMISCISVLYDNSPPFPMILDFFRDISGLMIQTISDFKDQVIVLNTTLSSFITTFKYYKLYMEPEPTKNLLNSICNICKETQSQTVVQNCIEVFKQVVSCFYKADPNSQLQIIIPLVMNLISIVFNRPDYLEADCIYDIYSLKEAVIEHINPNINNQIIIDIMESSFNICQETKSLRIFMNELHVFATIMLYYGENFVQHGLKISERILNLLDGPNPTVIEECLSCLIKIVSGLKEQAGPLLPQLKKQLLNAYESHSPGIITQVNLVIGTLFKNTGPMMADILKVSVESILKQISSALSDEGSIYFSQHIYYLVFPLSQILNSIPVHEPLSQFVRDELFPAFCSVAYSNILMKYGIQDFDEKNKFVEAILYGYSSIVSAFISDIRSLKDKKMQIFKIFDLLRSLEKITDDTLFAYCDFIDSCTKVMLKNVALRTRLRNNDVLEYLFWAECSTNPNLNYKAKTLIDIINPQAHK